MAASMIIPFPLLDLDMTANRIPKTQNKEPPAKSQSRLAGNVGGPLGGPIKDKIPEIAM